MRSNITQREQKEKLLALHRQTFIEEVLEAAPKDYQERNWAYHFACLLLSYPLQVISVLAGAYLLYDLARFAWQLEDPGLKAALVFGGCLVVFLGIELLRRWLVNTVGYHFLATFSIAGSDLRPGEWLKIKILWMALISVLLISTGTTGTYFYIKNNSPKAATISVDAALSPIENKIKEEKETLRHNDREIQQLLSNKKNELADPGSYVIWKGKEYLLPEVKQRHAHYDRQIAQMQSQRKSHQNLIEKYEERLTNKEKHTERVNARLTEQHRLSKEWYAGASAGIWFCFEILLLFSLSYGWMYRYEVKKEILLARSAPHSQENKSGFFRNFGREQEVLNYQAENPRKQEGREVGFEKWYEKKHSSESHSERPVQTRVIIKEVPVVKEVFIDREIPVQVVHKEVEYEGFPVVCEHCGRHEVKKRPAKYCSNHCRIKAWKEKGLKGKWEEV